ncbi:AAA family ATPase [Streptomyces sp. DSM 42041]|uniref:AAA family ATPase n=1 Tax=Streptomyces hazeniae TaxID=3075538 RepID=A0ABU2NNT8_9ACTN|nr:AAA family ATPase [Streptomyces sp. DSM 42041]MDT0377313.1 AAA family ATPase [Streptomyces sp. DSM 42041]
MEFAFAPATRESAMARIALQGPAGSGKTKTALRLAEGLAAGGPIGLVDTERRSALKYAPVPGRPDIEAHEFLHLPMDNHDPRNLIKAVRVAETAGVAVLIVDTWSHFWNGRGGLLEIVDQAGQRPGSGGSFGAWREANPIEQDMLDALLNFRGHLIVTMRTRGDYVIEGTKVKKVGIKAVQREGTEYEVDVVMDLVEGTGTVTKTRYTPLDGMVEHHPGEEVAAVILEQLGQGVNPVDAFLEELYAEGQTYHGALALHTRAKARNLLAAEAVHPVTGEVRPLEELIREHGTALKEAEQPKQPTQQQGQAPAGQGEAPARPAEQAPNGQEAQQQDEGEDAPATDGELHAALGSGHPEVEAAAAEELDRRASGPITPEQMKEVSDLFHRLGQKTPDAKLNAASLIVGRPVQSPDALTAHDATRCLEFLHTYVGAPNGREQMEEMLHHLADDAVRDGGELGDQVTAVRAEHPEPPPGSSYDDRAWAAAAATAAGAH